MFSSSIDLDKNKSKTTVFVNNNNNASISTANNNNVSGSNGTTTTEEEILKEFMRVQGALSTLTNTLQEAALTVQLDLVETISQLIFKNQENQNEFKKIDGYSFFTRLFDKIHDFSTSKESRLFLEDCFSILFTITLDGNKSRRVGNLDALEFLFRICIVSDQLDVKCQAIRCIQDILSLHPLNVVDVLFVGGIDSLFTLLLQFNSNPNENDFKQHEFILNVSNVLNYIGILLSNNDNLVLEKYLNAVDIYIDQKNITLKSLSLLLYSILNLISDCIYHRCPISLHSTSSVLGLLNNLLSSSASLQESHIALNNEVDFSVDVILQSLEIIGILVKEPLHFKHFKEMKGFELLNGLIIEYATNRGDIMQLSLWILQQLVALDTSATLYFKLLLDSNSLPLQHKTIICYSLAELLYKSNDNVHQSIRQLCKDIGILDILLRLSKDQIEINQEFVVSIIYLLGELASSSTDIQCYLHDHFGISSLLFLLRSIPLDLNLFIMILEMTTIPNLRDCLNFNPEYNKKNHSKLVLPRIANILTPKALHTKPVECSRNPLESLTLSSLSLSLKERNLNNDANTSSSSSRRSSFSNDEEQQHVDDVDEDDVNIETFLSNPQIEESDSRDDMVVEYDSNRNSFIVEYSTKRRLDTNSFYLNRIQIRSKDSALFILEVLSIFASKSTSQTQIEVLNILLKLLDANPKNKSIFCSVQAVKYLLNLASQCSEDLSGIYFQLVACIGSYDISPSEVRILFDLASLSLANSNEEDKIKREKDLQMELLNAIANITERKSPLSYFHFNGFDDYFEIKLDRFPRNTYSIAFWCRIEHFIYDGSPLFSFKDSSNKHIMSIYFKQEKLNKESSMRHYLCVETQTHPYPSEKVLLEECYFVEGGSWHHIAFTHSKQKFEFFMDGEIVQSASINYPTTLTKEKINSLIIGKRTILNQNNRVSTDVYFSGYLSSIHLYDGTLDDIQCAKLFSFGHSTINTPKLDIKEWLIINPLSYYNDISNNTTINNNTPPTLPNSSINIPPSITDPSIVATINTATSTTSTTTTTTTTSPGLLHTSIGNLLLTSNASALSLASDTLPSPKKDKATTGEVLETHYVYNGMSIHHCKSLKDVIRDVGGVQLCLPFLTMGSKQHLNIGLRIISSILQQSPINMKLFKEMQGFSILYTILRQSKDILTLESFEILIDLCCDGIHLRSKKRYIQHKDVLCLALDLILEDIDVNLQSNIVEFLIEFIISVPENINVLTSKEDPFMGIPYLLNFISKLQADSTIVLSLISKIIPTMSIDDLECIFDFILWEKDKLFDVTVNLLNLFYTELQKSSVLLDYFVKLGAFQIILSIIESPSEDIRISALKLLGLVLTSQKNKKLFLSTNGFDLLCSLLSAYPTSNILTITILHLSLGKFNSIEEKKSTWMDLFTTTTTTAGSNTTITSTSNDSISNALPQNSGNASNSSKEVSSIYHTEFIHVLMELLRLSKDWDLHVQVLIELMKCLDNKNMEILWNSPYLEWTVEYFQCIKAEGDDKIVLHLRRFLQKMFLYDISRKTSNLTKFKDMVEHEPFQIEVIECILDYLEEHPILAPLSPTDATINDIVFNLSNLFKYVEDIQELSPQVCKRIIDSINTLAYHNTAISRSYMKKYALFDLRDNLILRILRGSSNLSEIIQEEEEELDILDQNSTSSTNLVTMNNSISSTSDDFYLSETTIDFILNFSFESIADQKAFRDTNNGLLYLLNLLFISKNLPSIQLTLYDILRNIFGTVDENKKVLCSIFEDQEIIIRFFESPEIPNKEDYLNDIILDATTSPSKSLTTEGTTTTKLQSTITFLDWFYSDMAISKRNDLESKVKKLLTQPEAKYKSFIKTVTFIINILY